VAARDQRARRAAHGRRRRRALTRPRSTADQVEVIEDALQQIPAELIDTIEIVVRADSAGATHELLDFCREHRLRYTVGYELTDPVRAAILKIPEDAWIAALAADGSERETDRSPRSPRPWTSRHGRRGRG